MLHRESLGFYNRYRKRGLDMIYCNQYCCPNKDGCLRFTGNMHMPSLSIAFNIGPYGVYCDGYIPKHSIIVTSSTK